MRFLISLWFLIKLKYSLHQKRYEAAEALCRHAIARRPRSAILHESLSKVLARRGNWQEAIREQRLTISLSPSSSIVDYSTLVDLLLAAGEFAQACSEAEKLLNLSESVGQPRRSMYQFVGQKGLAWSSFGLGDYARAKDAFQALVVMSSGSSRKQLAEMIAQCEERLAWLK